jgi:hypothetical protein
MSPPRWPGPLDRSATSTAHVDAERDRDSRRHPAAKLCADRRGLNWSRTGRNQRKSTPLRSSVTPRVTPRSPLGSIPRWGIGRFLSGERGASGRTRTGDRPLRRRLLCPLSYRGGCEGARHAPARAGGAGARPDSIRESVAVRGGGGAGCDARRGRLTGLRGVGTVPAGAARWAALAAYDRLWEAAAAPEGRIEGLAALIALVAGGGEGGEAPAGGRRLRR